MLLGLPQPHGDGHDSPHRIREQCGERLRGRGLSGLPGERILGRLLGRGRKHRVQLHAERTVRVQRGYYNNYFQNYDTLPGTHVYVAGNFAWDNFDPNPCNGGTPTDGEGIDIANNNTYSYTG